MSSLNTVRFFIYAGLEFSQQQTQLLVNIAYQTARDRKLFPTEVLIRSGVHDTTKIHGKYQKDPLGPHATLCYKTEAQLRRGTHFASHGYVRSMNDWTYKSATHDPEKIDRIKKRNGEDIWPAPALLRELAPIEYGLPAECMEDWARTAEAAAAVHYNQTLDYSLSAPTSAGESSLAGSQQAQEVPSVNVEMDTFAEFEAKDSHYFRVKLLDGSIVRTEASQ